MPRVKDNMVHGTGGATEAGTSSKGKKKSYAEMIIEACTVLGDRNGSSVVAMRKYLEEKDYTAVHHMKLGLKTAVLTGKLVQVKGTGFSGSFKLKSAVKKSKAIVKKNTTGKEGANEDGSVPLTKKTTVPAPGGRAKYPVLKVVTPPAKVGKTRPRLDKDSTTVNANVKPIPTTTGKTGKNTVKIVKKPVKVNFKSKAKSASASEKHSEQSASEDSLPEIDTDSENEVEKVDNLAAPKSSKNSETVKNSSKTANKPAHGILKTTATAVKAVKTNITTSDKPLKPISKPGGKPVSVSEEDGDQSYSGSDTESEVETEQTEKVVSKSSNNSGTAKNGSKTENKSVPGSSKTTAAVVRAVKTNKTIPDKPVKAVSNPGRKPVPASEEDSDESAYENSRSGSETESEIEIGEAEKVPSKSSSNTGTGKNAANTVNKSAPASLKTTAAAVKAVKTNITTSDKPVKAVSNPGGKAAPASEEDSDQSFSGSDTESEVEMEQTKKVASKSSSNPGTSKNASKTVNKFIPTNQKTTASEMVKMVKTNATTADKLVKSVSMPVEKPDSDSEVDSEKSDSDDSLPDFDSEFEAEVEEISNLAASKSSKNSGTVKNASNPENKLAPASLKTTAAATKIAKVATTTASANKPVKAIFNTEGASASASEDDGDQSIFVEPLSESYTESEGEAEEIGSLVVPTSSKTSATIRNAPITGNKDDPGSSKATASSTVKTNATAADKPLKGISKPGGKPVGSSGRNIQQTVNKPLADFNAEEEFGEEKMKKVPQSSQSSKAVAVASKTDENLAPVKPKSAVAPKTAKAPTKKVTKKRVQAAPKGGRKAITSSQESLSILESTNIEPLGKRTRK